MMIESAMFKFTLIIVIAVLPTSLANERDEIIAKLVIDVLTVLNKPTSVVSFLCPGKGLIRILK